MSEFLRQAVQHQFEVVVNEIRAAGFDVFLERGEFCVRASGAPQLPLPASTKTVRAADVTPPVQTQNAGKTCATEDCDAPAVCRGLCGKHYQKLRKATKKA